jgi:hypothetical protein
MRRRIHDMCMSCHVTIVAKPLKCVIYEEEVHACHVTIVAKPIKFSYFLLFLLRFLLLPHTTPGRVVGAEGIDNVQHFALAIL